MGRHDFSISWNGMSIWVSYVGMNTIYGNEYIFFHIFIYLKVVLVFSWYESEMFSFRWTLLIYIHIYIYIWYFQKPSGKLLHSYGKINHVYWVNPLHISMAIFQFANCESLPEGRWHWHFNDQRLGCNGLQSTGRQWCHTPWAPCPKPVYQINGHDSGSDENWREKNPTLW